MARFPAAPGVTSMWAPGHRGLRTCRSWSRRGAPQKRLSLGVGIAVIDPEELTRLVLKFSVREEGGAVLRRCFRFRVDR